LPGTDRAKRGEALGSDPHELGATMVRVVLIRGQSVSHEDVGDALDALSGEPPCSRDLRHRQRRFVDRGEDPPPRGRLAGGPSHRVSGCDQESVQPEDVDDELAHRVSRGRAIALRSIDRMLSFGYVLGQDSILS
jgi:hypothetical protein